MMRKQYTAAFKAKVVQELLKEEKSLAQIALEYEVHPTQLKNWRTIALEGLPSLFEKRDNTVALKEEHERQLAELYPAAQCNNPTLTLTSPETIEKITYPCYTIL